jgi:prepilin-type N-terminal cleavage/methylation domain-containing protein
MSRTGVHKADARGFTLVELMVAMSVALIVLGGVLAAYLFLGRGLTRLINAQQQQTTSRRALRMFVDDITTANKLTAASATISNGVTTAASFAAEIPQAGGSTMTVTYTYNYNAAGSGTLTRYRSDTGQTLTLVRDVTSLAVNYFTTSEVASGTSFSTTKAAPGNALSVKAVQFQFTTSVGSSASGTLTSFTTLSQRVVLRNRALLQ